MSQIIKFGNILSVNEGIIVQGCNAQGVMGSGVAKAIRERYPIVYEIYNRAFREHGLTVGSVVNVSVKQSLVVASAITQEFFGKENKKYVSYSGISEAFCTIARHANESKSDVHYPLIGAGLGGGDWAIIQQIIESAFHDYPAVQRTLWIME